MSKLTIEEFEKIMENDDYSEVFSNLKDDNAFVGLQTIRKYIPTAGVSGANHDIIYSVDAEELVEAGITEEDAKYLRAINWMNEEGTMACYV